MYSNQLNKNKMIKEKNDRLLIDLNGPGGNAFSLMGNATTLGRKLGMSKKEIDNIINEMMEGDYEHLLSVFDREFGNLVILQR